MHRPRLNKENHNVCRRDRPSATNTTPRTGLGGKTTAVLPAAVLGLTATVAAASAQTDRAKPHPSADRKFEVLRFHVEFSPFTIIDVPPHAQQPGDYNPGDYVVFSDRLTNRDGERVGTEGGSGPLTKVTPATIQVHYTMAIRLPGGQLTASGLSTNAPTKRLVLTGGSGRYLGARGHLDLVENRDGTGFLTITWQRSESRPG